MKNTIFLLGMAMVLQLQAITTLCAQQEIFVADSDSDSESDRSLSLGGHGRFLGSKKRVTMTCDKYPRVCRIAGSPGPDCCKKSCVNVMKSKANCGMCGNKCKYSEICCKGTCVRPSSDRKNCGGCGNKCKKGIACVYGMCSYA